LSINRYCQNGCSKQKSHNYPFSVWRASLFDQFRKITTVKQMILNLICVGGVHFCPVIMEYLWCYRKNGLEQIKFFSVDSCLTGCGGWMNGRYFHCSFPDFILKFLLTNLTIYWQKTSWAYTLKQSSTYPIKTEILFYYRLALLANPTLIVKFQLIFVHICKDIGIDILNYLDDLAGCESPEKSWDAFNNLGHALVPF
jgi:hypothetical protein